jgi:hypothetical protein
MMLNGKTGRLALADLTAWLVLAVIVAAFLATQVRIHRGVYGESDSRTYLALAKRLATGGPVAVVDRDPFLHHDHTWVQTSQGKLAPKFPPGYPLLLVPFYWVGGDDGMLWASPALSAVALIGAFVLFRFWMSRVAALLAVAALGADGFVLCFGGYVLSHAADLCVTVWGMACLWAWIRSDRVGWGVAAGLLLGFAVLIRPANALLALPLGTVWIWKGWVGWPRNAVSHAQVAGAYLLMLLLLLIYQARVFGDPLTSGYGLSGESAALAWSYLPQRLPKYLDVFVRFVGLPFVVGGLGLVLFGPRLEKLVRLLWVLPLVLLYACYYWDAFWFQWLLRFLLATFPVFYGAMFGWIDSTHGRWAKSLVMVFLVVLPFLPVPKLNKGAFDLRASLQQRSETGCQPRAEVETLLQPDAVIFADQAGRDAFDSRRRFRVYFLNAFQKSYVPVTPPKTVEYEPKAQVSRQKEIQSFYRQCAPEELRRLKREKVLEFLDQGRQVVFLADAQRLKAEGADLAPDNGLSPMASTRDEPGFGQWELCAAERKK